jgi:hypothetical protein
MYVLENNPPGSVYVSYSVGQTGIVSKFKLKINYQQGRSASH